MNNPGGPLGQEMPIVIVTYRDVFQWVAKQKGISSSDYQDRSTIVRMSSSDMKVLGIVDDAPVRLRTSLGEVVVRAKSDPGCRQGFGFMPASPYSNKLASYDPVKGRLPNFKRIEVVVAPTDEKVDSSQTG